MVLNCSLGVVLPCSVWHSTFEKLGMGCIFCTGGLCFVSAVELSGPNLESGSFNDPDVMSRQASVFNQQSDAALIMK